ncbi:MULTISPECIES: DUF2752 domain-containing protein [unclassified Amycolatopsis]|uniref:DUF2752 domain-containing protein n=1 Tax=unclassified Amycolatopsis TaxID=2618356 RepID=UPI00039D29ED|nr:MULTISPECIES: DUF2752 domain-containing protein [unclassified Amycolatopsis]MCG3752451.1 DUF2752 domain-containing protein [Amycolatopsis sp. Poz14]
MALSTVYTGQPARGTRAVARALAGPAAAAGGIGLACVAVWFGDPTTPGGPLPVCPTKLLFGIDCPGCGGLRMAYSVLHGDFSAALHYNAVALVFAALFAWSGLAWTMGRLRGRTMRSWLHWRWTPHVVAVVFVLWFVARNVPFSPFTGLYV